MITNNDTNENKTTNDNSNDPDLNENQKPIDLNENQNPDTKTILTKEQKKKINDDYYNNNRDRILNERKLKREAKLNKLNESINSKDRSILSTKEIIEAQTIPIDPIDPNQYIFKQTEKYIFPKDSENLLEKYTNKKRSRALVLIGHAGTGKSQMARSYSIKKKIPLVFASLNNDIRSTDLLGSFTLKNNNSVFVLGEISKAIQIANTHSSKTCVLVLDELNTMSNEVQKILNENLNFRAGINIPLINKTYRLNEDSKILVIATMNYSSYQGTYQLNLELKSKLDFKTVKGLPDKVVKEILQAENIDEQTIDSLILFEKEILKAFEENKLSQPIDLRGLLKFAEDYNVNKNEYKKDHNESLIEALELTLAGRYSDNKEELNFVSELIESNFNVTIDP